jgi:hypothetical protein
MSRVANLATIILRLDINDSILYASSILMSVFVFFPISSTINLQFSFIVLGIPVISTVVPKLNYSISSILDFNVTTSSDKQLFSDLIL